MEQDSRYNGIVDPEGAAGGHHGHCHHGRRHDLWDDTCEDPRVLMYIDDNNCVRDGRVMGDRGHEARHEEQPETRQAEAEVAAPAQSAPQAAAETTPQYQEWQQQQASAEAAAQYQSWQQQQQQANAQNAYYQNWQQQQQQANTQGYYQGWSQEGTAQAQGYSNGSVRGQSCPGSQSHVHEVLGSVEIAEPQTEPHNHRFATVSGEARPLGVNNHYHDVRFRTDFYEDHFHEGWGRTGGAIQVGDRHVHFLEAVTTQNDGHLHRYRVATMIDDPIGD